MSQRTACRSQRQMCTKHRVRICGMRCESVDSFSQHEDLLRADYFPELFCYQSSLCCHYGSSGRTIDRFSPVRTAPAFYICLPFASGNASADAYTGGRFGESVQALDFPMMVLHKGGIVPRKGIEIKSF